MNEIDLKKELNKVSSLRVNRLRVANMVLQNKPLFSPLVHLSFLVNDKISVKATWILEFVCKERLCWLIPHLDYFTKNNHYVYFKGAVRSMAKICEILAKAHVQREIELTTQQIDLIIEVSFDRLIQDTKVAVKAYVMETLYLLGKNTGWVYEELLTIIQQNITYESAAYKARGKKIIKALLK